MTNDEIIAFHKAQHDRRNACLAENMFCLRDDIQFPIHPESRFPFEFFTWRSPPMVEEMNCFLQHANGKKCLFDIGALHGIFTLAFLTNHPEKSALVLEPSLLAYPKLLHNLRDHLNAYCGGIAASDRGGSMSMSYDWEHMVKSNGKDFIGVERMTGDAFCSSLNEKPDLIKIDVEGHECKVLDGLHNTIADNRPVIFLEIHTDLMAKENDSIDDLKTIINYHLYRVSNTSYQHIPMDKLNEAQHVVLTP